MSTETKLEAVYLERLNRVVEAVEKLPPIRFALNEWSCGSVCCAVGAYCLANPDAELFLSGGWPKLSRGNECILHDSWGAVQIHFGLDQDEAEHLFYSGAYFDPDVERDALRGEPARAAVLQRLREFIAQHS